MAGDGNNVPILFSKSQAENDPEFFFCTALTVDIGLARIGDQQLNLPSCGVARTRIGCSAACEIKHVIDQRRHPRHALLHQSENFARCFLLVFFRQHSRAGGMPIVCGVSRRAGRGSIAHKVPKNVRLHHLSRNQ